MKTKQIVGIVVTGAVIIAVGVTGALSNVLSSKMAAKQAETTKSVFSQIIDDQANQKMDLPNEDFIGVMNIEGEIAASSDSAFKSDSGYNHELYMNYVDQMEKSDKNKGILLYVNSPGGAVYQTDEMYLKLMEYKEKTGRPIWAYFADEACSGGYYMAMAADKIYANRNCWTGSIGVIVSLMNCKDLYDKIGLKEIDITSGANKSMGSAGLDLTDEQYKILQSLVDEAYDQFVGIVSTGRKIDESTVRKLADGRIYSAKQAKEKGLIDEIGSIEEEKKAFEEEAGLPKNITYFTPDDSLSSFMKSLFGAAKKLTPKSETDLAQDIIENKGNGVLKYYAE